MVELMILRLVLCAFLQPRMLSSAGYASMLLVLIQQYHSTICYIEHSFFYSIGVGKQDLQHFFGRSC